MAETEVKEKPKEEAPAKPTWVLPDTKPRPRAVGLQDGEGWLLYGPPKVGKSTFASTFPTPLILDLEEGYRRIKCAAPLRPKNLQEFRECFAMIRQRVREDKFPFETIVIDSADKLNSWLEVEVCRELGIIQMGKGDYGSDWGLGREKWFKTINAFRDLRKTVVVVGHSKHALFESGMRARTTDLPGKLARMFSATMDYIGYCYGEKDKETGNIGRWVTFEPYEGLDAGCRHPALTGAALPMHYRHISNHVKKWEEDQNAEGDG